MVNTALEVGRLPTKRFQVASKRLVPAMARQERERRVHSSASLANKRMRQRCIFSGLKIGNISKRTTSFDLF